MALTGLDVAAGSFLVGMLLWGLWQGSRYPLLILASLFFGSLASYSLYPLVAVQVADRAGLPLLPACVISAGGVLALISVVALLGCRKLVRAANARAQEVRLEPSGEDTFWTHTTLMFADGEEDERPGGLSRLTGGVFALLLGGWVVAAVGLVSAMLDPPFPGATVGSSRVGAIQRDQVLPQLERAPHLALATRLALLSRAAAEINRAGPTAVEAAANAPGIRAIFTQPAIASALDDEGLARLIRTGDLKSALRHPRLVELLRRTDARTALVNVDLREAVGAAEAIVAGRRNLSETPLATAHPGPEPQPEPELTVDLPPEPTGDLPQPTGDLPPEPTGDPPTEPTGDLPPEDAPSHSVTPQPDIIPALPQPAVHGHRDHVCGEGCPRFAPPHGHRWHSCDVGCPQFSPPHGQGGHRCDRSCAEFTPPHGDPKHVCGESCASFVPPHGHRLHACDATCPSYAPPHGHSDHRCNERCAKFIPPHGHRLHSCDEHCPDFSPPHGHRLHVCAEGCPEWAAPHGHPRHTCREGCSQWVAPHGHPAHRCSEDCPRWVAPHGHPAHACAEDCAQWVAPHGHPQHACARGCPSWVAPIPPPEPAKPTPEPAKPTAAAEAPKRDSRPPTPVRVRSVYAATNPYALQPTDQLRPGQRFALRAEIDLYEAQAGKVRKRVSWRVLSAEGVSIEAFERTDWTPAAVGVRTAYVSGIVPPTFEPGTYTVEVSVALPEHAPVVATSKLIVAAAPVLVRSVQVRASPRSTAAISSASAGITVYAHGVYAVDPSVAARSRRVSWQVSDTSGRPVTELEGSKRFAGGGAGTFAFVEPLELPADLPPGTYWLRLAVEAGGEPAEGQCVLVVGR